jgi:hypothetical protein
MNNLLGNQASPILGNFPATDQRISFAKAKCEHNNLSDEIYSDCGCSAEMSGEDLDYGLCPVCHDHCGGYRICLDCEEEIPYGV